jgi:hypothetical protein
LWRWSQLEQLIIQFQQFIGQLFVELRTDIQ